MENYLVDRETLDEIVDSLIARQTQPIADLSSLREESVKKLDDQIGNAVFGKLSNEQLIEMDILLDKPDLDESTIQKFFENAGVNVEQTIADTITKFSQEFLGGTNE